MRARSIPLIGALVVALLLPLTLAFHGAVRRRDTRAGVPDPPTTVGGNEPSEELQ